jgi:hypothetical protein
MVTIGLFHCPSFLQPGSLAFTPIVADGLLVEELGCRLKVSPFCRRLTRAIPPNRVHGQAHQSLFVTDWQFASSCSPRSDYSAAVTFSYRPVDSDLTGTPTPLQRLLRSRTTAPTAVGSGDWLGIKDVKSIIKSGKSKRSPTGKLRACSPHQTGAS